ncbi:MAG: hypothetical protein OEM82_11045 [Acidobacteriota bacterium]|nr:hypothetical protein [Acidobacteriota bacterium]MDH3529940.1 hypothetical protein [Acidobacteriota bacterium]
MARTLSFSIPKKKTRFTAAITKVDRTKLYGDVRIEAFDENDERCELVSIASDGQTLFGRGGIAFATMNQDGEFVEKSELIPIDDDGEVIEMSESSFTGDIELSETATVEDYLSHQVKSVYMLENAEDPEALKEILKDGDIYSFEFSYRKGIIVDTGFLLANDKGDPFMILTTPADIQFLSFNDSTGLDDEEDMDEDDGLDFGSL